MRPEDRKRYEAECRPKKTQKTATLLSPPKAVLDESTGQWTFPPVTTTQHIPTPFPTTDSYPPPSTLTSPSDLFAFPSNAVPQDQFPIQSQNDQTQSLVLSTLLAPSKDQPQLINEAEKLINDNTEYEQSTESWFTSPYVAPPPPTNPVPGCTNPQAINYNPNANIDDGTCTFPPPPPVLGCTNPQATNYNPNATQDDGTCVIPPPPIVTGCTDATATNYNPNATQDDGTCTYPPPPPPPVLGCTNPQATNYNPNATQDDGTCVIPLPLTPQMSPSTTITPFPSAMQMMINQTIKSQQSPTVDSQDPDGIKWLTPQIWANTTWDGTPFDTTGKTNSQICSWLRPSNSYAIRGIREKFYQVNPFQDNTNPTPAEIEEWNIEVIRHMRALLGNTRPVRNDPRLYLEARWADERKRTTAWDTQYPSTSYGTASGICWTTTGTAVDTAGGHCGEAFFPNSQDRAQAISQQPYQNDFQKYPDLTNYATEPRRAQAAGINSINADIPWSIKLSVIIANWICTEGLTAHPGPYVGTGARATFGCSWWYTGGTTTSYRGKWR